MKHAVRDMPKAERPRYRAKSLGAQALSNTELLQLITGAPHMDICLELLTHAGTLTDLDHMTAPEIARVHGIGEGTAIAIKAAFELGRRLMSETDERQQIRSPDQAANLLISRYGNEQQEHFLVILLDTRNRVLHVEDLYRGSGNTILIRISEVFREAVRRNAFAIIVAHNHPSGDVTPSPDDIKVATEIVRAGDLMGIEVLDSLIFSKAGFISLKERGLLSESNTMWKAIEVP